MKEKILEAFARLGFCLEKSDDVGYEFEYEGMTLLYLCNEDDEDFLTIALPGFYEYDEENVATYCALSEKINASLKYVKAFTPGHSMWLCYERELFGGEDLEALISRMIAHLEAGVVFASKAVKAIEEQFADSDDTSEGCEERTTTNHNWRTFLWTKDQWSSACWKTWATSRGWIATATCCFAFR